MYITASHDGSEGGTGRGSTASAAGRPQQRHPGCAAEPAHRRAAAPDSTPRPEEREVVGRIAGLKSCAAPPEIPDANSPFQLITINCEIDREQQAGKNICLLRADNIRYGAPGLKADLFAHRDAGRQFRGGSRRSMNQKQ
ncbi:hypothetical protein [Pseudacidovorax intermedius]|uniref:hypothetical protein n=1 Tax=Pseudacidovorax intermedius TaxID=433924 RepID=UPI0011C06A5D|nr:hypothetical protein [Pseudacidovorax intermedius]